MSFFEIHTPGGSWLGSWAILPISYIICSFPSSNFGILVTHVETASTLLCLLLHHLGNLHVHVEELGGASVEADALALVELALAVVVGNALLCADSRQAGIVKY